MKLAPEQISGVSGQHTFGSYGSAALSFSAFIPESQAAGYSATHNKQARGCLCCEEKGSGAILSWAARIS